MMVEKQGNLLFLGIKELSSPSCINFKQDAQTLMYITTSNKSLDIYKSAEYIEIPTYSTRQGT